MASPKFTVLPDWIDPSDKRQMAVYRRGFGLGLRGKPQPTAGECFMVLHAGWKAGRKERDRRLLAKEKKGGRR